ncbi:MAG: carboxypeptidase-like regulatory domain-containing protein, partial [Gemmatimonadaceae bacterium]
VGRTVPGYVARKEDEDGARAMMPAIVRLATPTSSDTLATLVGTIADEKGKILPSADIWIGTSVDSASNRTETDSLGHFRIAALPPGTTTIGVRRMGSRPSSFALTLPRGDSLLVAIRVSTVVNILPEVKVEERADLARLKQLGFTDRSRRFSRANFRDPDDIKRHVPSQLVDLLSGTMGATVGRVNAYGGGTIPMGRGAGGTSCPMALYVDGMFYDTMRQSGRGSVPMPIEDVVNISDVRAAEIYTDGPDVPAEFQAPGLKRACGALVLWTDQSFP